ncbi:hypothetical protein C1M49_02345 [Streptococcus intermedius]|uniref:hypothetical protein n=1 Tax=Streptococcus intermedius TaxID=1338 RepID=UPI000C863A87|nr:hypothetical protein [Streptococcus intermedius]PMR92919.1 hypothetical protein C1M49_02345 [Streptococcus intermedius]
MNGVERSILLGEGNENLWEKLQIYPLNNIWEKRLNGLSDLIVGGYNLKRCEIKTVAGGCCIYKSQGEIELLPLSFLLELLNIYVFSAKLNAKGIVLLPIAEECHNYPILTERFEKLGKKIENIILKISRKFNLNVSCNISKKINVGVVEKESLYGLFHPFSLNSVKSLYPLGDIAEEKILKGYESYSLRYRYIDSHRVSNKFLIVDGLHLSKSVITGLNMKGQYVVTTPFPSLLEDENCLLVDSQYNPSILDTDLNRLDKLEYFDNILKCELNISLIDVIKFTQELIKFSIYEENSHG